MNNHVCDYLDVIEEHYKFDKWDSFYKKNFEVYEILTICPICNKHGIWLEYRYYKNDTDFDVYDSELTWKEK